MSSPLDAYPRPLSPREAEVLDFMLDVDDQRIEPLRGQRASVVVSGMCGCGCASIKLSVDRERSLPAEICGQPISAWPIPKLEANESCGLDLFLDEGWLSLLEICWIEDPPKEFPPASAFTSPRVACVDADASFFRQATFMRTPFSFRKSRWRTWIRIHTPDFVFYRLRLAVPKARDCGDHDWYAQGDGIDACYHCITNRATPPDSPIATRRAAGEPWMREPRSEP